jgi:hypothetical protein
MYGRADGMPSFQLTVAVCVDLKKSVEYILCCNSRDGATNARQVLYQSQYILGNLIFPLNNAHTQTKSTIKTSKKLNTRDSPNTIE